MRARPGKTAGNKPGKPSRKIYEKLSTTERPSETLQAGKKKRGRQHKDDSGDKENTIDIENMVA